LLWSFVYLVVRNLFALVWLLGRPRHSKEVEILVLRHELAILRRQAAPPRLTRAASSSKRGRSKRCLRGQAQAVAVSNDRCARPGPATERPGPFARGGLDEAPHTL
jgi:hypothetical protein